MSGVLHPVGPEPERVYWIRRGVVVLALAALVSLVLVLVNALGGGGGPTAVPPSVTPEPSPSASAPSSPAPSPTPSGSVAPSSGSSSAATPAPPTSPAPSATPSASASPQRVAAACDPAKLRPTLRGAQKVESGQPVTFALSFINGGKAACTLAFDRRSYELKIFSASSRVWTTKDCSTAIKPVRVLLAPEKAFEFTMAWSGLRSADDCKNRKGALSKGTYFVTSQLEGAEPVQLPVKLT